MSALPRTWGRLFAEDGSYAWTEVNPDPATGQWDPIYLTTLIQVLRLGLGESPYHANFGIPARQSVLTQVAPDYAAAQTQQQFQQGFGRGPCFASIVIARAALGPALTYANPTPTYSANVLTHAGVPVPVVYPPTGQSPVPY